MASDKYILFVCRYIHLYVIIEAACCKNVPKFVLTLINTTQVRLWGDESMQKTIDAVEQGGASIHHAVDH